MKVVALSTANWAKVTRAAAGVEPVVLPDRRPPGAKPWPEAVAECDFLYVNLHGLRGQPYWYGDRLATAVAAAEVARWHLSGAIAFVAACFGLDEAGAPGPMVQALLDAGCAAVMAGVGLSYGGRGLPPRPISDLGALHGVDLLGLWVRRALVLGWPAGRALTAAKGILLIPALASGAARDALDFRLIGDPVIGIAR